MSTSPGCPLTRRNARNPPSETIFCFAPFRVLDHPIASSRAMEALWSTCPDTDVQQALGRSLPASSDHEQGHSLQATVDRLSASISSPVSEKVRAPALAAACSPFLAPGMGSTTGFSMSHRSAT